MQSGQRAGTIAAVAALAIDQATKAAALAAAPYLLGRGLPVMPGLNLTLIRNPGISFGLLGTVPWWALAIAGAAIILWLVREMWRARDRRAAIGFGLIVGGALGNVLDRLRFGGVTDFIDLHAGRFRWPAFNLADVAIFCGALLLIWVTMRGERRPRTP